MDNTARELVDKLSARGWKEIRIGVPDWSNWPWASMFADATSLQVNDSFASYRKTLLVFKPSISSLIQTSRRLALALKAASWRPNV
jgi:hypothetical protein